MPVITAHDVDDAMRVIEPGVEFGGLDIEALTEQSFPYLSEDQIQEVMQRLHQS